MRQYCSVTAQSLGVLELDKKTHKDHSQRRPCVHPVLLKAVHCAFAQRRPRVHPVLLTALCTAPATKSSPSAAPATRKAAAAPTRSSSPRLRRNNLQSRFTKHCACHAKGSRGPAAPTCPVLLTALCAEPATVHQVLRLPHKRQPRPTSHVHPVLLKALCTAPATKSVLQVHQVLYLPHERQPRPSGMHASTRRRADAKECGRGAAGAESMINKNPTQ